jgi:phosphomevalonate kinase
MSDKAIDKYNKHFKEKQIDKIKIFTDNELDLATSNCLLKDAYDELQQQHEAEKRSIFKALKKVMFRIAKKDCPLKMGIDDNIECARQRKLISGLGGCLCCRDNCYKIRLLDTVKSKYKVEGE